MNTHTHQISKQAESKTENTNMKVRFKEFKMQETEFNQRPRFSFHFKDLCRQKCCFAPLIKSSAVMNIHRYTSVDMILQEK